MEVFDSCSPSISIRSDTPHRCNADIPARVAYVAEPAPTDGGFRLTRPLDLNSFRYRSLCRKPPGLRVAYVAEPAPPDGGFDSCSPSISPQNFSTKVTNIFPIPRSL